MLRLLLKFKLILWKNFIIRKRHWLLTLFEIAIPIILAICNLLILAQIHNKYVPDATYQPPTYLDSTRTSNLKLYYAPNGTEEINKLMDKVEGVVHLQEYESFATEKEMIDFINVQMENRTDYSLRSQLVAVVFDDLPTDDTLPDDLKYRIRTFMPEERDLFQNFILQPSMWNTYIDYNFVNIQYAIDKIFIETKSNSNVKVTVSIQQMPYPPHAEPTYKLILSSSTPILLIFGFLFLFFNVLKRVIQEKSTGIKELMKMMGLDSWMLWSGWFIYAMAINIIPITVISLIFKYGLGASLPAVIPKGDAFIVWLLLFLYITNMLCFIFAFSTLCKKPALGTSIGIFIWMFFIFFGNTIVNNQSVSQNVKYLCLLIPNVLFQSGFYGIVAFEDGEGINFSNMWQIPNKYEAYPPLGCVLWTFILESLFLCIFTWYVENVFPGEYGVPRPFYFPFTRSYWFNNKVKDVDINQMSMDQGPEFEKNDFSSNAGITLSGVHKYFGHHHVVKGLSFNIHKKEITALLGHNGAGKTTTMNMITGLTPTSKGTITVNGYNISKNIDTVRQSLGLCPQFDVQFTDLTVIEHLMFFAMLRGYDRTTAKIEARELLLKLNLLVKEDVLAGDLSGGMRRKLSLAMAIVGNSDILILDEPTSGLDPEARREIWDFLMAMRGTKTILITTHYMEEADVLGDRIAIMHDGSLRCYGSTLFLKKHYGTGYNLNILVENEYRIDNIRKEILSHVPTAVIKTMSGNSITFNLPTSDTTLLSRLFINLEKNKLHLNILNFGVSITTMEDVFLRVGEIADELDRGVQKDEEESRYLLASNYDSNDVEKVTSPISLLLHQFKGLMIKRFYYMKHKWVLSLMNILIPFLIILSAIVAMKFSAEDTSTAVDDDFSLKLNLNLYNKPLVFYSNNDVLTDVSNIYTQLVKKENAKIERVPSVSDAIISVGLKSMEDYAHELIVAAEFNKTQTIEFNGLYGTFAYHSAPISLNLISNTLLRSHTKTDKFSLSVTNNPLKMKQEVYLKYILQSLTSALIWMFLIPIGFTIMIGLLVIFSQQERSTGVLHLQVMAGVPRALYWFTNFIYDYGVHILLMLLMIITTVVMDVSGSFNNDSAIGALALLLTAYGLAILPFTYIFTYTRTAATIMTRLMLIQVIIGSVGAIIIVVLETINSDDMKTARNVTMFVLYIFPQFAFAFGIFIVTKHSIDLNSWENAKDEKEKQLLCVLGNPCCQNNGTECADYLTFYGHNPLNSIKNNLIFLIAHCVIYTAILLFIETGIPRKVYENIKDKILRSYLQDENLNEDVIEEKCRVETQLKDGCVSDILITRNLKKWYNRNVYAARNLNFGVKPGECFGLLGVNGAGKTTTFKMLTGDIPSSEGTSFINNYSIHLNKTDYLRNIGYCPQFNALNFNLTGKEMLIAFAYIRGIPSNRIKPEVEKWLYRCGIKQYENKISQAYSGGNKRKLSTAVALIGNPSIVMLDEPTCGVDPVARRKLWDVLTSIRQMGQSVVLTTHSMEECEALCDRLAIMVDGQFRCIGNIQTLKTKYGQGFTVVIKLLSGIQVSDIDINKIKNEMANAFHCSLKDQHMGMLQYHIDPVNASIASIFPFMENLKKQHNFIEDYSVNDTSLEEVFLSFAKTKYIPVLANRTNIV